jgi:hypothetical protein
MATIIEQQQLTIESTSHYKPQTYKPSQATMNIIWIYSITISILFSQFVLLDLSYAKTTHAPINTLSIDGDKME